MGRRRRRYRESGTAPRTRTGTGPASRLPSAEARSLTLPGACIRCERRRFTQQIFHRAVNLLLIADPLARATERCGDFIDAPRQQLRIRRERRLLPNQFHLLLDARDLRIDERQLALRLLALLDALFEDLHLPGDAPSQFRRGGRIVHLPFERGVPLRQLLVFFAAAQDGADRASGDQQPQEHPGETAEAVRLRLEAVRRLLRRSPILELDDPATALRQRG